MDVSLFAQRRAAVFQQMGPDGVLVLASAQSFARNNDVEHPFRQDSDFYYLTGCEEPSAVLVLVGGATPRAILYLREQDPARAIWDGPRLGLEGALALGMDQARPIGALAPELSGLLMGHRALHCRFAGGANGDSLDERWLVALAAARRTGRRGGVYPTKLLDAEPLIHSMRRTKDQAELALMARAADISVEAHLAAMRFAQAGKYEYQVDAVLTNVFRHEGCSRVAYDSIVASGSMATTLHYVANSRQMQEGELLLIDAGCEHKYYAADITRTFPVGGTYSTPQREAYEVVLEAQYAAIEACRVGQTFEGVHGAAVEVIARGLIRLGVLAEGLAEVLERELYKPYFMHKTSHYLGMDVHDVGDYYEGAEPKPFEEGIVITVEPGLYFSPTAPEAAARYRGIGIRIEDDLVIGADKVLNLTEALPKQATEVERVCRS